MACFTFSVESMIHGYHEYKCIWESPSPADHLFCQREIGNPHDTHAVAVMGSVAGAAVATVGHVPRKISAICSIFIRRGGTIICVVNGARRYSVDLPQGGLEIPCVLKFTAKIQSEAAKTESLLVSALNITSTGISEETQTVPLNKLCSDVKDHVAVLAVVNDAISKSESRPTVNLTSSTDSPPAKKQKTFDTEKIIMGDELSDGEINNAQRLLKTKHPKVGGLRLTLYNGKFQDIENNVQIVHCPTRHHWITATTLNCKAGEIKIFDSLFTFCDKETRGILYEFYQRGTEKLTITMSRCQKQTGGKDCGLFSIAFAVALVFNLNGSKLKFRQEMMRPHLVDCFTKGVMTPFPCK